MKFVNVPIGAKILIYKQQVNVKLEDELVFNETLGHLESEKPDTEVELIDKCYNCKHFDSHIRFCDKLGIGIELGDDESIDQDPETFSFSMAKRYILTKSSM